MLSSFTAKTPAQRIFAAQADYNGVLAAAVAYESQPRCSEAVVVACSNTEVVNVIRTADTAAYNALRAAQNVIRTPGVTDSATELALASAVQAVAAFRGIMSELEL